MNKILLILALALGVTVAASAKDTVVRDESVLPQAARTVIANNFKSKVSLIKIDKDFGRISEYEVIMTDGTEITFDRNGNWEKIETNKSKSVPSSMVPKAIATYVSKNQPGTHIVGIEKDRKGYEIELSDGIDIKFDRNGGFIRYDD